MNPIKLCDIAQLVSMSDSALSHFFKKRTNRNIVDYINDIRISMPQKCYSRRQIPLAKSHSYAGSTTSQTSTVSLKKIKEKRPRNTGNRYKRL